MVPRADNDPEDREPRRVLILTSTQEDGAAYDVGFTDGLRAGEKHGYWAGFFSGLGLGLGACVWLFFGR
jgi:hypothetical protein